MKRVPLPWLLLGGVVIAWALTAFFGGRALSSRDARVDSLRTEVLGERAAALGWETRMVGTTEQLEQRLQELGDSTALLAREKADLAREVELLGGRLESMVDLYAGVVGTIERHDAVVHHSAPDSTTVVLDSITGHVSDGLLSADVTATVEPPTVSIPSYSVELALALGWTVAPDGRALATAMASDPRVTLRVGEAWYQPPAQITRNSFWTRLKDHGRGYAFGRLLEFALTELMP